MDTRVLLVAPSPRYVGGQSVQAERLRADLSTTPGVAVDMLYVDPRLSGLVGALQEVRFVRTVVTSAVYVLSLLRRVRQYDVVHAYSASYWSFLLAPVPALLVARLFGKRAILNYHSGEAPDHFARWGWHARPLARLATRIVVPSPWLAAVLASFDLPSDVIHNSLDLTAVPHRRRTSLRPMFLTNRSLQAHYNVAGVLDAFAVIQSVHPTASLTVAGDGPERAALEAQVTRLQLQHVTFVGACDRDTMYRLYDAADVLLNASMIDNMPLTLIEAAAAGLPVVTSDAGGIPNMLERGLRASMVPAGDAQALGSAALALLADAATALQAADASREAVFQDYTWSAVRDKWLRAYGAASASGDVAA